MQLHFDLSYFNEKNQECFTSTIAPGWQACHQGWKHDGLGLSLAWSITPHALGQRITIPQNSLKETGQNRFKTLTVLLENAAGHEGDNGALFLPLDTGMVCRNAGKQEREYRFPVFCEREWDIFWCNMALYGWQNNDGCTGVVLEGGKFDCELRLRTNWGDAHEYRIDPLYLIREWPGDAIQPGDISLFLGHVPERKYTALAAWFRKYNRDVRQLPSLQEKCKDNPALAYSMKAITVRCRMAVKQLPCVVYEQKPDTQPPVHVYMNYEKVEAIAKRYAEVGVGPAEFCLVGWNYGGHDGAFPQLFPVCEAVGTEDEMRHAGKVLNECGYRLNLHDNYYDAYSLAENLDLNDLCTDDTPPYHMPVHGGGILGGGRAYRLCGKMALKYQQANLKEVQKRFPEFSGAYFIDVASLICSHRCANPAHPETREDNAAANKQMLQNLQDIYGVSSSEGARDWSLPELDRAYMLINKPGNEKTYDYTDEAIPLYQLIYHGYVIYNTFRSGINAWPGSFDYLWNLALGGMPTVYYHHLFNPAWGASSGCKNDLNTTEEAIKDDTLLIKQISDDIARISHLQGVIMTDFIRHGKSVTETRFENGPRVFANFGETPEEIDGISIEPMDFVVKESL